MHQSKEIIIKVLSIFFINLMIGIFYLPSTTVSFTKVLVNILYMPLGWLIGAFVSTWAFPHIMTELITSPISSLQKSIFWFYFLSFMSVITLITYFVYSREKNNHKILYCLFLAVSICFNLLFLKCFLATAEC